MNQGFCDRVVSQSGGPPTGPDPLMGAKTGRAWTILRIVLLSAIVISVASYVYLWNTYYDALPSSPDKAAGRVYVDNFHGFARYESPKERFRLHALDNSWTALTIIFILAEGLREWRLRVKRAAKNRSTAG